MSNLVVRKNEKDLSFSNVFFLLNNYFGKYLFVDFLLRKIMYALVV